MCSFSGNTDQYKEIFDYVMYIVGEVSVKAVMI